MVERDVCCRVAALGAFARIKLTVLSASLMPQFGCSVFGDTRKMVRIAYNFVYYSNLL